MSWDDWGPNLEMQYKLRQMLPFDEARERILTKAHVLGSETVALDAACERVLSENILADAPIPAFDNSAMDGYAACSLDFQGAGPWTLPVHGESRAGAALDQLAPGSVCRIFTGAVVPEGADSVIIQENVTRTDDTIWTSHPPAPGEHVRKRGSDLNQNAVALRQGAKLTPYALGLLAALDKTTVQVTRQPKVAIISTGDELRAPGSAKAPGTIPESNSVAIRALAQRAGANVVFQTRVHDDLEMTRQAIDHALEQADLLVTIGGVSVGEHDVVKAALEAAGVELDFWKVRIKPGKPLAVGSKEDRIFMGLPGNPVSAQLTFSLFGLPLLRAMLGQQEPLPQPHSVVLTQALPHKPGRRSFYRGILRGDQFTPAVNQGSGAANSLAEANALAIAPEDAGDFPQGASLEAYRLDEL